MSDLISRQTAISAINERWSRTENFDGWGADISEDCEEVLNALPSADRPTDEEDQLKFYYVESIDDYWIGMRVDNFYYADWHEGLGFVWSKSRYLPWGKHVINKNTLWKEYTCPSKPVEIPFTDWIVGFVKKYFADRPTGKWIDMSNGGAIRTPWWESGKCDQCGKYGSKTWDYCPHCGAKMEVER